MIHVENLSKAFSVKKSKGNQTGFLRNLLNPTYETISAVNGISFDIKPGERVAFIGPNGAGKSTTIKMLSGILYPTDGHATVNGLVPWQQRKELAYQIGCVFGQNALLWSGVPVQDSYFVLSKIYDMPQDRFKARLKHLVDICAIDDLLDRMPRQMSLGQRMRCEIVASLLHAPPVIFLDEPTIGVDVVIKAAIRDMILSLAKEEGVTVLLTSHDVGDIETVCERVIIIDHGQIVIDDSVTKMKSSLSRYKRLTFVTQQANFVLPVMHGVTRLEHEPHRTVYEVDTTVVRAEQVMTQALALGGIEDMTITEPPLENLIRDVYKQTRPS